MVTNNERNNLNKKSLQNVRPSAANSNSSDDSGVTKKNVDDAFNLKDSPVGFTVSANPTSDENANHKKYVDETTGEYFETNDDDVLEVGQKK